MKRKSSDDFDDMELLKELVVREKRRPIRNFKRAYLDHMDDYDEIDDFYSSR